MSWYKVLPGQLDTEQLKYLKEDYDAFLADYGRWNVLNLVTGQLELLVVMERCTHCAQPYPQFHLGSKCLFGSSKWEASYWYRR